MRAYPQDARKGRVEFGRDQLEKTTSTKKKQARVADEPKPACLKWLARLCNNRPLAGQGKGDHRATDEQRESRAKRVPARQERCAQWRDRTIGVASPRPDGFVPHER